MGQDVAIGGVLFPSLLLWGLAAVILMMPLSWLLAVTGFYRFVWHRGLFDICLAVILWGGLAMLASS